MSIDGPFTHSHIISTFLLCQHKWGRTESVNVRREESDAHSTVGQEHAHIRSRRRTQITKLSVPHLENLLIQDAGAEHSDAVGVNGRMLTPEEGFADLLLAVDNDGDGLLLHADGHTVPPKVNTKRKIFAFL